MGWTGSLNRGTSTKDYLINEFSGEDADFIWAFTDVSMRGTTAYGIASRQDKKTGIVLAEALVVLTRKEDGWIYHKEMGETVMPYYFDAPKKLLDKLDALYPPFNENAIKWRTICREEANKKKVKLKYGDVIKFSKTMRFPNIGLGTDTFTYTEWNGKRNIFTSETGKLVCIPKWQHKEFTVLSN